MPKKTTKVATLTIIGFVMLAAVFLLRPSTSAQAPDTSAQSNERTVQNKIPPHVPIKVQLKKEKASKAKSLTNEKWVRDVQLEITNTSRKPIYYIALWIVMPDVRTQDGTQYGFNLNYGRGDFLRIETLATKDDIAIKPYETITLKVKDSVAEGWEVRIAAGTVLQPRNIEFRLVHLSFGDGSGFDGAGRAFPYRRASSTCREGPPTSPSFSFFATQNIPAFLPVSFFLPVFSDVALTPDPPDVCCPGSSCTFRKSVTYTCQCEGSETPNTPTTESAACTDPAGICSIDTSIVEPCGTHPIAQCMTYSLGACGPSSTPTPTPTPSPTPTPCPETSPSNCASGVPVDYCTNENPPGIEQGCPSTYERDSTGMCCVKKICHNANNPPPCDNDKVLILSEFPHCQWLCVDVPQPPCQEPVEGYIEWCRTMDWPYNPDTCLCGPTPIVVDIAGNGFNLTNSVGGVRFDINADGTPDNISWTSANSDDAWLALDRNGNGLVDNGQELFGDATPQPEPLPGVLRNGFLALAEFDKPQYGGNGDGKITKTDAVFQSLRLWRDRNHNGISEPSELHKLKDLGLKTIELDYKMSRRVDEHGNQFKYRAKVKDTNDAQLGRWAWDVILVTHR